MDANGVLNAIFDPVTNAIRIFHGTTDVTDLVANWIAASSAGPASLDFHEDTDNGVNYARVTAPAALGGDRVLTLPDSTGTLETTAGAQAKADEKVPVAGVYAAAGTDVHGSRVTADAADRFVRNADGSMEWGDGTAAPDTNLYRSAANTLATDDNLVTHFGESSQIALADLAGNPGIIFGSAFDTNLYRSAADTLKTDDSLIALSAQVVGKTGANATPITLGGGTASGAPSAGAHLKGEVVFDDNGTGYYCTVAGTPGTWLPIGQPGVIAESHTLTSVHTTTDLTSLFALTLPGGRVAVGDRVMFKMWGWVQNSSGGAVNLTITPKIGSLSLPSAAGALSVANDATGTNRRRFVVTIEVIFPTLTTQVVDSGWMISGSGAADLAVIATTLDNRGVVSNSGANDSANNIVFGVDVQWGTSSAAAIVTCLGGSLELVQKA